MEISEEVYLEHFGVKGMHWGQRKRSDKADGSKEPPSSHKAKTAAAAAAIAGGGTVAAVALHSGGKVIGQMIKEKRLELAVRDVLRKQNGEVLRKGKKMVVYAPGRFKPGTFMDAGVQQLTRGMKALAA